MSTRRALVLAIFLIFGAAMVAEFAGLVDRPVAEGASEPAADEEARFTTVSERQLRIGAMGGFVLVCLYVIMRHQGVV